MALSDGQAELERALGDRLVIVPGDGSCFYHAIKVAAGCDSPVDELRGMAGQVDGGWAEERNVQQLADALRLRIRIHVVEVCRVSEGLGGEWGIDVGPDSGGQVALVMWTAGGDGVHFDALRPEGSSAGVVAGMVASLDLGSKAKGSGARRMYCPVPGCPKGCAAQAAGWASWQGLRGHLMEHVHGRLQGEIPEAWMKEKGLGQCAVCSGLVSGKWNGVCPKCRPAFRRGEGYQVAAGRPLPKGMPSWVDVATAKIRTKVAVPKAARQGWAQCVVGCLAQILEYDDERAWLERYMLPKAVLRSSGRGGKKAGGKKGAERETLGRIQKWLSGCRDELWEGSGGGRRVGDSKEARDMSSERRARAIELAGEGLLSKACTALLSEPPVEVTSEVIADMKDKHPKERASERERCGRLRVVSPEAGMEVSEEAVLAAVRDFRKRSASGPIWNQAPTLEGCIGGGLG